jgi:hypothetical protein
MSLAALSAAALLRLCDAGARRGGIDRALLILREAFPAVDPEVWLRMPIGRRDAHLMDVREATYGAALPCVVHCPACREKLEFTVDLRALRLQPPPGDGPFELTVGHHCVRFRLPDSADLAFAADALELDEVRARLLHRCVLDGPDPLSPELADAVSVEMARRDPQADVSFDQTCPECGARWSAPFDVGAYLWREIEADGARLLDDVDALARVYGWSEAEILSLSSARRQQYLRRVGAP